MATDTANGRWRPAGGLTRDHRLPSRQLDYLLVECVDAGLAGVLFIVPLILGGRIALGQLVLVALTLWTAICWCLKQCLTPRATWVRSSAGPLLLLALVLVAVQLTPLPSAWLKAISPNLAETLPLWFSDADSTAAIGNWSTLSLTPTATRDGFVLLLAFVLLFLTTVQRIRHVEDVERLLRWVAIAALAMAAFGLVQYFTANGKFFWFYEHPFATTGGLVVGSFTNRNHFSHFVVLGIGPLIWWVQTEIAGRSRKSRTAPQRPVYSLLSGDTRAGLLAIGLGIAVFAVLISLSRGGTVAMFAAVVVCLLILCHGSLISRRTFLAVSGIGLLIATSLCVYGYELITQRFDELIGAVKQFDTDGRVALWRSDAKAIADFPWTGTGLGSHCEVCPMYHHDASNAVDVEYTHAESGYVQVALESGLPGLLLALTGIALCGFWCSSSVCRTPDPRLLMCLAGVAGSLAANFVHAAVDFVWYVPGLMVVVVVLAACACRLWQLGRQRRGESTSPLPIPRAGWLAAAACLALLGFFMVQNRLGATRAEPSWHRCLTLSKDIAYLDDADRLDRLKALQENLSATLQWAPDNARAHARLAAVHLALFDQPQEPGIAPITAKQLSDTVARDPKLQSSADVNRWLSRAFPKRRRHLDLALRHARQALALCPLLGENYLFLADLSFLTEGSSPPDVELLSQAIKVRPHDGLVLFAAGQNAALAGEFDKAVELWRMSARAGPRHQERLAKLLIPMPQFPVAAVIEIAQPDRQLLQQMRRQYKKLARADALYVLNRHIAEVSQQRASGLQGMAAAVCWLDAAEAYKQLNEPGQSLRCLQRAVASDWSCFDARRQLGTSLLELNEFVDAEKHLRWCLRRKPYDGRLRDQVKKAIDGRFRLGSRGAGTKL